LVILFVLVLICIPLGPFLFVKDFGLKILGKRKRGLEKGQSLTKGLNFATIIKKIT